jgi:hypothetical protein
MVQIGTKLKVIILRNHKTHQIFNLSSIYGKLVVGGLQSISLSSKLKKWFVHSIEHWRSFGVQIVGQNNLWLATSLESKVQRRSISQKKTLSVPTSIGQGKGAENTKEKCRQCFTSALIANAGVLRLSRPASRARRTSNPKMLIANIPSFPSSSVVSVPQQLRPLPCLLTLLCLACLQISAILNPETVLMCVCMSERSCN